MATLAPGIIRRATASRTTESAGSVFGGSESNQRWRSTTCASTGRDAVGARGATATISTPREAIASTATMSHTGGMNRSDFDVALVALMPPLGELALMT